MGYHAIMLSYPINTPMAYDTTRKIATQQIKYRRIWVKAASRHSKNATVPLSYVARVKGRQERRNRGRQERRNNATNKNTINGKNKERCRSQPSKWRYNNAPPGALPKKKKKKTSPHYIGPHLYVFFLARVTTHKLSNMLITS